MATSPSSVCNRCRPSRTCASSARRALPYTCVYHNAIAAAPETQLTRLTSQPSQAALVKLRTVRA